MFTTKVTKLKTGYGCRVFDNGLLVVEGLAKTRIDSLETIFKSLK